MIERLMKEIPLSKDVSIRTLLPMAVDGVGPSHTCINILNAMHQAGQAVDVFAVRRRTGPPEVQMHLAIPRALSALPFPWIAPAASKWIERQFLNSVRDGDIAYLWPSASLKAHRVLHDRGVPVVLEGINTRMASAKRILDAAYDAFGAAAGHGITDERIEEEEEKYHYSKAIFAPNVHVENALKQSPLAEGILPSSYGVDPARASPERAYRPDKQGLTFIFCGYFSVRKGAHHLLEAWSRLRGQHRLVLVGNIEPVIAERYRDLLSSDAIEVVGFVKDVHSHFATADVFVMPSLEEGGPQVTYEAALHGLPILASPMGSGRMGDTPGVMEIVDPVDTLAFTDALERFAESVDLRESLGRSARHLVNSFSWSQVGASRALALRAWHSGLS
jgi:glycosyltransferase involved in cell wall biosynthesis